MTKQRQTVPRATRDALLREFNFRCAICGADRPHVHHIDEDPANNSLDNLLPLCPNCHLVDEHDASNRTPLEKLKLFRRHKHRGILSAQFNPLFCRMRFLYAMEEDAGELEANAKELIRFVSNLEMGRFYAGAVEELLSPPVVGTFFVLGDPESERRHDEAVRAGEVAYVQQVRSAAPKVEALVIEMLDYQPWKAHQ